MPRVSVTEFRAGLARWIELVKRPEEYVILTANGREVAALVSIAALELIWNAQDEARIGPINPKTGRPLGRAWVIERFGGRYERNRDPEAHLYPSREDAPWLGRPFDWPPPGSLPDGTAGAEASAEGRPAEAGDGETGSLPRLWWLRWWW